jgi:hypothetical protein
MSEIVVIKIFISLFVLFIVQENCFFLRILVAGSKTKTRVEV